MLTTPTQSWIQNYRFSQNTIIRRIFGANGDFDRPVEDVLYRYFYTYYAGTTPTKAQLKSQNETFSTNDVFHVLCQRNNIGSDYKGGKNWTVNGESYVFQCYAKYNSDSELWPELETMVREVERIMLSSYQKYNIAGIDKIDHFRAAPVQVVHGTDTVFMCACSITVYYQVDTGLDDWPNEPHNPTAAYDASKRPAGSIRDIVDGNMPPYPADPGPLL